MTVSAAQTLDPVESMLNEAWDSAATLKSRGSMAFDRLKQIAEDANNATDVETLVLNPYHQDLKAQVFSRILNGEPPGQVLDYLYDRLDGESPEYVAKVLKDMAYEFEDMGLKDMAREIMQVLTIVPLSDYGLDIDFFGTGPNADGSVEVAGEVSRLRHFIEHHFEQESLRGKLQPKPFLGIGYG